MLPFRLRPVYKNYLWGGTRLIDEWAKNPDSKTLAESWELASHKDGDNVILDGELSGITLSDAAKKYPEIVSHNFKSDETFPLMIKLIDSQQPLSIQVHPYNDYARRVEHSRGKTEAWYILNHDDGAYIYLGFSRSVSRKDFHQAIMNNTCTELLRKIYVNDGDLFFIPAGTVHAIGPGITLAEIQENSNITYRVYDYGRLGTDGKPRELHIAKALDVANTFPLNVSPPGRAGNVIVSCSKFHVKKVTAPFTDKANRESFKFLLCLDGESEFTCGKFLCRLMKGSNIYVPANCCEEFCVDGNGEFLVASLGIR